jgi:hypothetical protein
MTERTPRIGDIIDAWTDAEREVWNAWSNVDQDVSRPDSTHGCGEVLDALEASAQQLADFQSAVVRSACGGMRANSLLPPEAQALVEQACRPLQSLSDCQQLLVSAWFGMARQMAISVPGRGPRRARHRGQVPRPRKLH